MKRFHLVPAVPAARDAAPSIGPGGDEPFDAIADPPAEWDAAVADVPGRPGPGAHAVVIDVLRASTTLTVALDHGAAEVIPAASLDEARAIRERRPDGLLCGERRGRIVPGFDLGNSPFEYTRERVAGRTLIFASTNGSQALALAAGAARTWLGAFVSARALVERLSDVEDVWLIASGARGRPSLEDLACAGWFARALAAGGHAPAGPWSARVAELAPVDAADVRARVEAARDARVLRALGPAYARDVGFCASLDRVGRAWAMP